jgi:regulatory protein
MGQITDIQSQARREGRVSVFVDEDFWTGMPADIAGEHNLRIGQDISAEKQLQIEQQLAEETAFASATNLLSFRDRSEHEMRKRLAEKQYGESVIELTIVRLREYNYLDDEAFALQLAESQLIRGRGKRAAQHALRQSGLEPELIEIAIDQAYAADSEHEAALDFLQKKPKPEDAAAKQKLLRGLASRGFPFDVSLRAMEQRISESD